MQPYHKAKNAEENLPHIVHEKRNMSRKTYNCSHRSYMLMVDFTSMISLYIYE